MKYLLALILLTLFSCAHHHEWKDHHHHQGKSNYTKSPEDLKVKYDHECYCSVMEGDKHIAGERGAPT